MGNGGRGKLQFSSGKIRKEREGCPFKLEDNYGIISKEIG